MTKARHKEIEEIYANLREIRDDLAEIIDEERNAYDGIPENLRKPTEMANTEEVIDELDNALSSLSDALESLFNAL